LFGGRAAREGVVTTIAVKGDRKVTRTDQRGQIRIRRRTVVRRRSRHPMQAENVNLDGTPVMT
jgi:hypothetical protein